MNFTKTQTKSILWHILKAILCTVQLFLLDRVAVLGVEALLFELVEIQSIGYALLRLGVDVALFVALWWYYDHIDDYSFNRFCEAPAIPVLLHDPGFIVEHSLTVLGATPVLAQALLAALGFTSLRTAESIAISLACGAVFVTVASLIRIRSLNSTWAVQKNLRSKQEKKRSRVTYMVGRFIYAAIYTADRNTAITVDDILSTDNWQEISDAFTTVMKMAGDFFKLPKVIADAEEREAVELHDGEEDTSKN